MSDTEDVLPTESEVHESILTKFRCQFVLPEQDLYSEFELAIDYSEVSIKVKYGTTDMALANSRRSVVKYKQLLKLLEACLDEDSEPVYMLRVISSEFVADSVRPVATDTVISISLDGPFGLREWLAVHIKATLMLAEIYGIDDYKHYQESPKPKLLPLNRANKPSTSN